MLDRAILKLDEAIAYTKYARRRLLRGEHISREVNLIMDMLADAETNVSMAFGDLDEDTSAFDNPMPTGAVDTEVTHG